MARDESPGSLAGVAALAVAAHPLPALAVTAFAVALGIAQRAPEAGGPGRLLLLGAAVLTGQLSVGWCNDWVDADRDRAAHRPDKPVARGVLGRRTVAAAAFAAAAACVLLSFALGLVPGALHVLAVASAWAYDLELKATLLSPLPYVVSFGLLTGVVTTSVGAGVPEVALVGAAGLLGAAAHFANTVGDAEADTLTGVRGLPQRMGPRRSLTVSAAGVAAAAVVLLTGVQDPQPVSVALLGAGAGIAGLSLLESVRRRGRTSRASFRLCLLAVALVVGGFVAG